ncbi:MAG TPA: nitrophenyl compound nitroreductase subunit ArsF family protein [Candidatus Hydrogenedentes bacterium]|nr:nitrophenyl compound nitroreductase subunit ArsF family protein [Candidatus Hydrogenedentota bacterium]HNT87406.1 nitrophenyl compound nitroreductase subunit ArsF family protein [Candidatus Hydrogenedentota bacterium]
MQLKAVVTVVLLAFVVGSVGYMVARDARSTDETARERPDAIAANASQAEDALADATAHASPVRHVYYFHRTQRCSTCLGIESHTEAVLRDRFAPELGQGALTWAPCNVDEPRHEHFVRDFELLFSGVIIAEEQDGKILRWKNLEDVWKLAHEPEKLRDYLTTEIQRFIGEG